MNKISIVGLNSEKSWLVKDIMDLGVVEVSSQDSKLADPEWLSYVKKDGNEDAVLNYDSKISKINDVLITLEGYDTSKKPLFSTRRLVSSKEFDSMVDNINDVEGNVAKVVELSKSYNNLCSEQNKLETSILSLKPWVKYELPLEFRETIYTSIFIGVVPSVIDVDRLKSDLDQETDKYVIDILASDKEQYYITTICLTKEKDDVYEVLKQFGFNNAEFKDLTGTASENIALYEKRLKEISESKSAIEKNFSEYVQYKEEIQAYYDYLTIEKDKNKILGNMLKTDTTFYLQGWIPDSSKEQIGSVLKKYECWFEISEPEEGEPYPILLNNNSFSQPFESITELYSLPSPTSIDPTSIMAPFYMMFFGLMLADVGYGAIISGACFIILRKFNIEGNLKKMMKMFFYCGLATIFWGIMFGSYFGDALTTIARVMFNGDFAIKPIWINPITEPMTLLIFSLLFGVVHLFVGMGIKAYMDIRDGHPLDALFDIGFWYGFIIGIALWLFGNSVIAGSNVVGKWMTIVFGIGLILTQGREKEGLISKLFSGVLSLYGITSYLSDVLSYSRLLALGLATGVISSVVSVLGSLGGTGIFASILLVVVLLIGHTFNIAINSLGTFVHAARLQYVEFFGKFYEGGGDAFNPFMKKTKYIKITK
ncbi:MULTISPECIES: V-type ATP synthase subunit I [unclassified Sedimentibacter]|uniref:V-type ATP synthase subunit I n=1 Tax=unclassified Sedimentibacter TaxID=2649220 RepID=UPI0027E1110D|nr:V-type ATP synthase subunit I [Sedimentibacter sp. MB35-C1]WMJ78151.1 V-type ATP synthase subunit I [Sedimentibacter sp. MB35-C1]